MNKIMIISTECMCVQDLSPFRIAFYQIKFSYVWLLIVSTNLFLQDTASTATPKDGKLLVNTFKCAQHSKSLPSSIFPPDYVQRDGQKPSTSKGFDGDDPDDDDDDEDEEDGLSDPSSSTGSGEEGMLSSHKS